MPTDEQVRAAVEAYRRNLADPDREHHSAMRAALEAAEGVSGWQPIETAPQDGERFAAAARIVRTGTKEFLYWQTDVWWFDEGKFRTDADNGIWFDDCELWCRLPAYPVLPAAPAQEVER